MTHGDVKEEGVRPRTCGHAFILSGTCKECKRYVEELRIARGADPETGRPFAFERGQT